MGAGGEKKARKKGKLNPHVLNLLKGPDSKLEMQLGLQSWLSRSCRAPSLLPGSQAAPAGKIRSEISEHSLLGGGKDEQSFSLSS